MAKTEFRFLFKKPLGEDWAFKVWVSISLLAVGSVLLTNLTNGGIYLENATNVMSGLIDGSVQVVGNFIAWYLVSLIWLIPRRLFAR